MHRPNTQREIFLVLVGQTTIGDQKDERATILAWAKVFGAVLLAGPIERRRPRESAKEVRPAKFFAPLALFRLVLVLVFLVVRIVLAIVRIFLGNPVEPVA